MLIDAYSELVCVRCGASGLLYQPHALACQSCGTNYPIVHDVPILFPNVVVQPVASAIDIEAIAISVSNYQGLPKDAATLESVKSIFSTNYRFGNFLLDVESKQYLDRIKTTQIHQNTASEKKIRLILFRFLYPIKVFVNRFLGPTYKLFDIIVDRKNKFASKLHQKSQTALIAAPYPIQYEWILDYLPRTILSRHRFTGNVRLQNSGKFPISSQGSTPVMISYHWHSTDRVCSNVLEHRTPFPIELAPGREITIPMLIESPREAGKYELELCLVQEYVCWHEINSIRIPVEVVTQPISDLTSFWQKIASADTYSYYDDHQRGVSLLKSHLKTLNQTNPKILEIGGNACPMLLYDFPGQLYNLDIDVHGLQIGYLSSHCSTLTFICADAHIIPFPDNYFDCITIFASLHHFPDLRVTLRSLATKINSEGFLAIMCEPVGHPYGASFDPLFLEELSKGVNEQSFSLAEYALIFQDAGLITDKIIVDGSSIKAFLKKV